MSTEGPIDVTVIGGYLGAGKTTLLNHLLRSHDPDTGRLVVLVNDFGEINIDLDLIVASTDDTIELANGCICCSLVDGFAAALDQVVALDPPPTRLVIEASGVSDPSKIAAYAHAPGLALGAVAVVADAEQVRTQSTDRFVGTTVVRQLEGADIVILNKTDLVSPAELAQCRSRLGDVAPEALMVECVDGAVDPQVVLAPELDSADRPGEAVGDPAAHESWSHEWTALTERESLELAVGELPRGIMRVKGIVWCEGEDEARPWLVQRVGHRTSTVPLSAEVRNAIPAERRGHSRLVCIGEPSTLGPEGLAGHLSRWTDGLVGDRQST